MSESQPVTPGSDIDDELKQALAAAFGDDAMSLMDDDDFDDFDDISSEMIPPDVSPAKSTPLATHVRDLSEIFNHDDDDVSPLIRYMNELNQAIYGNALAPPKNGSELSAGQQELMSGSVRFVVFTVDDQQFGVQLSDVLEIARYPNNVTRLPRTPSWLRGVANFRGQILSITDLRDLLQFSGARPVIGERIIVIHSKEYNASTAIVVDRVVGIRSLENEDGDINDLSQHVASIASAVAKVDQAAIVMIDPDLLLGCAEPLANARWQEVTTVHEPVAAKQQNHSKTCQKQST